MEFSVSLAASGIFRYARPASQRGGSCQLPSTPVSSRAAAPAPSSCCFRRILASEHPSSSFLSTPHSGSASDERDGCFFLGFSASIDSSLLLPRDNSVCNLEMMPSEMWYPTKGP
ncbi:hypothetical protein GUJ93_ZPchr0012g18985 [Zizania palustris]|uniref:Uncharacterized protein n=1 Tax=Zizania palustris TaxID=103762 RepID=A0A8J5WS64_ZIZPA|nr:hypothetical protein GUJ93_ZPchr0012g18985 [Zizania palustris]